MYGIQLQMLEAPDVPAFAISAFERLSGLAVSFHDFSRTLWSYLPPDRFEHLNPYCRAVKTLRIPACLRFEALIQDDLRRQPEGLVKVCHAGYVEWVVPVVQEDVLRWILFAGVRRPGANLHRILKDPSPLPHHGPWSAGALALPAVDDEEAMWVLENLRQLNERLITWHAGLQPGPRHALPRPEVVRQFIIQHHARADFCLGDLARELGLSESRSGHVVQESCGESFIELVTRLRLRTAAGLLRHSGLPLVRILAASGFGNRSHFHQLFRRAFGISPGRYRRRTVAAAQDR
jgi:AraC-like DNA-binding protein